MIYECEFDWILKETVEVFKGHDIDVYLEGPRKATIWVTLSYEPAKTGSMYLQNASLGC